jgi:hypothetical protein
MAQIKAILLMDRQVQYLCFLRRLWDDINFLSDLVQSDLVPSGLRGSAGPNLAPAWAKPA